MKVIVVFNLFFFVFYLVLGWSFIPLAPITAFVFWTSSIISAWFAMVIQSTENGEKQDKKMLEMLEMWLKYNTDKQLI